MKTISIFSYLLRASTTVVLGAMIFGNTTFGQKLNMESFQAMKPRNIGPAGMSGRVTAIDAIHADPNVIYAGTASGGLWKTEGGGVTWKPIFEHQKAASIGAVAIYQKNPQVIWVGTGEGNPRNSQTSGNGVYKSIDGGNSWTHLGLDKTRNIHRLIVHPDNPDIAYVGAQGSAWGESPDRGVFKTSDGGATWDKVLFINNQTGVADMVVDPSNPDKIVVAMWEFRRWPWFFKSGGVGSGIYITHNGGKTWDKRDVNDGLPDGELGRVGLAISRSNPKVIYALVEAKKNGLYRSNDGGFKWSLVSEEDIGDRPFYYHDIAVDPANENRLYNVFSNVKVSNDGGKIFETLLGWDRVHGDHHFWWIHPNDPKFIINGNDGGLAISRDWGKSWRFVENLPVAQFYHISVDMETPYNVMGGMQDNGSWKGPNRVWRKGGIRNGYWSEVAFGDGFDVSPDLDNPRYGYGMWQGGNLLRLDNETGASRYIKPVHPEGEFLRFNWNTPIARDPFDPSTIYYGSQYLHRTSDEGRNWEIISPDLTTDNPEKQKQDQTGGLSFDITQAENNTTIVSIAPSPLKKGVIWVGTDDGNIQLTQDGGDTWTKVSDRIKGFPADSWVPQIQASAFKEGEAFAVVNNYRMDDWTPYLYHTTDFGKTWTNLVSAGQIWGYVLSVVQDPVEPNLIFLGSEFGLYVSIDRGKTWAQWTAGYPTVSTYDMVIHPRDHDLVIGTFGRSAWVLDDIRPLRELAANGMGILDQAIKAFTPTDAILAHYRQATGTRFHADAIYRGENKDFGALITFWLKNLYKDEQGEIRKSDTADVRILDGQTNVVRNLKIPVKAGMNRFSWDLGRAGIIMPSAKKSPAPKSDPTGPAVLPGTYTVEVKYGDLRSEATVNVKLDPRLDISVADLQKNEEIMSRVINSGKKVATAIDMLREAKETISLVNKRASGNPETEASLKKQGAEINAKIDNLWLQIIPNDQIQGLNRDPKLLGIQLEGISRYFNGTFAAGNAAFYTPNPVWVAPSPNTIRLVEQTEKNVNAVMLKVDSFLANDWSEYQRSVSEAGIALFSDYQKITD